MTTIDTARLRALSEAATHKRWKATTQGGIEADDYTGPGEVFDSVASVHDSADWEYIEAADPQTMLALLDEIERLRGAGEWEYNIAYPRIDSNGNRFWAPDGLPPVSLEEAKEEFRQHRDLYLEGDQIVRRRKAGPWGPVEGDGDE